MLAFHLTITKVKYRYHANTEDIATTIPDFLFWKVKLKNTLLKSSNIWLYKKPSTKFSITYHFLIDLQPWN